MPLNKGDFRREWAGVCGKCPVTGEELRKGERLLNQAGVIGSVDGGTLRWRFRFDLLFYRQPSALQGFNILFFEQKVFRKRRVGTFAFFLLPFVLRRSRVSRSEDSKPYQG